MPLTSDLTLDASKFDPANITSKTTKFNANLQKTFDALPNWWDVGAPQFRTMRMRGETALAAPVLRSQRYGDPIAGCRAVRSLPNDLTSRRGGG
ncbi:hypothetical protein DL98DRAFT_661173 [Cadophora sp. DSE1049]|nr:hypothetical protein DL98DRAFT_661173 [Cadophora sp. DSE1049]